LIDSIIKSVGYIAQGRKALDIAGETEMGRVSYHLGLDGAAVTFTKVAAGNDAEAVIYAEHSFLTEERRFCDSSDSVAISSLQAASDSFDDALRALSVVTDTSLYPGAELTFPRSSKYRVGAMPKDAFHIACIAHRTRLKNILTAPGVNMTEKAIYKQRLVNMGVAQKIYTTLQEHTLAPLCVPSPGTSPPNVR
jgi:hypothetical protein